MVSGFVNCLIWSAFVFCELYVFFVDRIIIIIGNIDLINNNNGICYYDRHHYDNEANNSCQEHHYSVSSLIYTYCYKKFSITTYYTPCTNIIMYRLHYTSLFMYLYIVI